MRNEEMRNEKWENEEMSKRENIFHLVMYNIKVDYFYMSLCSYANVLIPSLRIYRLSSKHDKDVLFHS